jgi:hypothetical protein
VIDRSSLIRFAFPIGKDKPACLGLQTLPEHGSRPICERDYPASILALAFPNPQEAEPRTIDRRKRNVRPFQMQSLSDAQLSRSGLDSQVLGPAAGLRTLLGRQAERSGLPVILSE